MQARTLLNAAAPLVADAIFGWLAASVRLATLVQPEDKPGASAGLDRTMRQVFALANQHMRWELNDMARRLDDWLAAAELHEGLVPSPAGSASGLSPDGLRMLRAIGDLTEEKREVFDQVRIQRITQAEAAQVLEVSAATVNWRLDRGLRLLTEQLADLRPGEGPPDPI